LDIERLAVFFGEEISGEFLLPIMMSLLNRNETSLKLSFLKRVGDVCKVSINAKSDSRVFPCILTAIYGICSLSYPSFLLLLLLQYWLTIQTRKKW
jgi:hypothetical protein